LFAVPESDSLERYNSGRADKNPVKAVLTILNRRRIDEKKAVS
jgi:hypothetical protein